MKTRIVTTADHRFFVRTGGSGPPLVLLHASPMTSASLLPLAEGLADRFTVVAVDTPGYGRSAPLPTPPRALADYVPAFRQLFAALGLERFHLYGTATGAQLAIRIALTEPGRVERLYLDNAAHFTDEQAAAIVEDYFPGLAPQWDGRHLLRAWTMVRNLLRYFPWFDERESARVGTQLPPAAVLHTIARDYLTAGAGYATAYRLAFAHERAANVRALTVPTTLFHHRGSIIERYIRQLTEQDLPPNVVVVPTPAPAADKAAAVRQEMLRHATGAADFQLQLGSCAPAPSPGPDPTLLPPGLHQPPRPDEYGNYLTTAWFQLRDHAPGAAPAELHRRLLTWLHQ